MILFKLPLALANGERTYSGGFSQISASNPLGMVRAGALIAGRDACAPVVPLT
jgi:hypothetical protein